MCLFQFFEFQLTFTFSHPIFNSIILYFSLAISSFFISVLASPGSYLTVQSL